MFDADRAGAYDGAPPLPRHEANTHVRGQPCLDDAAAFVWVLMWRCQPIDGAVGGGEPLSRRSFPSPLDCSELQLGFWNALMEGVSPVSGSALDFSCETKVLSDAEVARRCGEFRKLDPTLPTKLLGWLGRCFRDAADTPTMVTEDRIALLLRAEAAYEAVHLGPGGSGGGGNGGAVPTVPLNSTFSKATTTATPQRNGGVGSGTGTPRNSYPSPFRARQLGQTMSPRSVGGSPLAYSPLSQQLTRRARVASPAPVAGPTLLMPPNGGADHPVTDDDVRCFIVE